MLNRASRPCLAGWALLLLAPLAAAEDVGPLVWKLTQSIGAVNSQWREKTPAGNVHVKEHGGLSTATTALTASHPWLDVTVRHEQMRGNRDYEGVTNQGQRASSVSGVRNGTLGLSAFKRVNATWALGVGVDRVAMHRDIRSTATASGYPEHYRYTLGKVGIQHRLTVAEGWHLHTHVWMGRAFAPALSLRLPGFDAVSMNLGHGRTAEVAWQLVKTFPDSHWQAAVTLAHRRDRFTAGDAVTLFKSGRIAGSAQQPAWQHSATQLSAGLVYGF